MLKKLASVLVIVALAAVPVVLAGCEKDEIHTSREVTIQDQVISQDTVVE